LVIKFNMIIESLSAYGTAFHELCQSIFGVLKLLLELLWSEKRWDDANRKRRCNLFIMIDALALRRKNL